ncbi:MAG: hypothetical protein DWQ01_04375 [Planctomycetota bacterium]|nr:MAG: hypothetical protein DWQ01_04375 [Planctomycetota bacterium]
MTRNRSPHILTEGRLEFFRDLLQEKKQKGLTLKQVAKDKDIPMSTLHYWSQRIRKLSLDKTEGQAPRNPAFLEVRQNTSLASPHRLEIELPNGIKLRFPLSIATNELAAFLQALSC